MKQKKPTLKKHQRIGLLLTSAGIVMCFVGYNSTLAALTGITFVIVGGLLIAEPYLWG